MLLLHLKLIQYNFTSIKLKGKKTNKTNSCSLWGRSPGPMYPRLLVSKAYKGTFFLIISLSLNELSLKHAVPNNNSLTQAVNSLTSKCLTAQTPNLLDSVNPL